MGECSACESGCSEQCRRSGLLWPGRSPRSQGKCEVAVRGGHSPSGRSQSQVYVVGQLMLLLGEPRADGSLQTEGLDLCVQRPHLQASESCLRAALLTRAHEESQNLLHRRSLALTPPGSWESAESHSSPAPEPSARHERSEWGRGARNIVLASFYLKQNRTRKTSNPLFFNNEEI